MQFDKFTRFEQILEPASYGAAAEAFSSEIDCSGYRQLAIIVTCGVFQATGDVVFQCEESATSGSGFVDITGALVAEKVLADDQKVYVGLINLEKRLQYIRVGYDVDDDACIFGILAALINPKYPPSSQQNTLAFSV